MNHFSRVSDNEYLVIECLISSHTLAQHRNNIQDCDGDNKPCSKDWLGLCVIGVMLLVSSISFTVVATKIAEAWTIESHKVGAPLDSPIHWDF